MNDQFVEKAKTWDSVPWKNDLADDVYRIIKDVKNVSPLSHLVDIGGGTGLLTLKFLDDVKNITVIDTSQSMLNILKEKIAVLDLQNVDIIDDYFTADTYDNDSIDIFISMLTLHHIPDIKDFFISIYNALKVGGNISIVDLETESGDFHMEGVEYFHNGFDSNELKQILDDLGFKNISISPAFTVTKKSKHNEVKSYPLLYMEAYK